MKLKKKLVSLLLTLVLVLGLATTAFAGTHKLTINATKGHTYKIYQLLRGDVSKLNDNDDSGVLSNIEAGYNLDLKGAEAAQAVKNFLADIKDQTGAALGNIAHGYITGTPRSVEATSNGPVQTEVLDGYYIIEDTYTGAAVADGSDTLSRYMVAVVGDTTVSPKISTPSIDKIIANTNAPNAPIDTENKKTNTAAIGDVINYKITSNVPDMDGYTYYYYVINDTLSEGLTLDDTSFAVTIGGTALGTDQYHVYVTGQSFKLAMEDLKKMVDDKLVQVDDEIVITYNATVNDQAFIGKDPNTNTANLEYSNDPTDSVRKDVDSEHPGVPDPGNALGEGPDLVTKTYVTELTLLKVDENGKKLTGAQFTLTGDNLTRVIVETNTTFEPATGAAAEYYLLTNGTYTRTAPNAETDPNGADYNRDQYVEPEKGPQYARVTTVNPVSQVATGSQISGMVNSEGYITFTGLNAGTYTLTETVTPDSYSTMQPLTFEIKASQSGSTESAGGSITWSSTSDKIVLNGAKGIFDGTIENVPGTLLPGTGGMGTTILYVAGSILLIGAAVLFIMKKRAGVER